MAEYAEKEAGDLAGALGLPARGYTEEEAEERRAAYGANALEGRPADTVAHRLRRAFVNPFSVVLFVLAGISFVTDVLLASDYSRDVTTAAIILSMLLVGGSVRFVQELRSKRVADRLTGLMATTVPAWREGRWRELPSAELVVGDRVRLSAGDRVPADLRLTAAAELFVTQSVLTGESAILEKTARPLPKSENRPLAQYHNIAFMGSAVVGGSGEGIVLAVGPDRKNGFDRGANSIAWVLIRFMAVLVPVVFIACGLTKGDWLSAFLFALSVAVGLTPEMLPFLPMMSLQLIFLNLIYDLSCTAIPWDNVDEEFLKAPRRWDASSVGSFMIWLGPTSSIFDFLTYIFMYFVFCPRFVSGGVLYNDLVNHFSGAQLAQVQAAYIALFQAGWFVESMWSQTLVIHMIRTPKIPFIQSRASAPLTLLTCTGIAVLTAIPFTPLGGLLGFAALPVSYFAYLIPCILLYMVLATSLKKAYEHHYGELL